MPRMIPTRVAMRCLSTAAALMITATSASAVPVTLSLTTDDFSAETSFELVDVSAPATNIAFDSWVGTVFTPPLAALDDGFVTPGDLASGGIFGVPQDLTFDWHLAPGNYEFTIFDTVGDGICCLYGNGAFQLQIDGGSLFPDPPGGTFGSSQTVAFEVTGAIPEPSGAALFAAGLAVVGSRLRSRR